MEEKCALKPHFWFSFPKRAPSQNKLQIWRNTANNTFSVLTSMPYWKLHSLFPSKFLPSTIRPLSLRLGKGLWHNQQQRKCFNSSVNSATEVYCYQTDTEGKAAAACTGHLLCLEDRPLVGKSPSKAQGWLCRERAQRFGVWDLDTGRAEFESRVWDLWQIT